MAVRKKKYRLYADQQFIAWRPGLRVVLLDSRKERCGSRKLKAVFQEQALPAPLRENTPLVYDVNQELVVRVCLSFWESREDLCFG